MVKEAIGKIGKASKGKTGIIFIPSDLMIDSAFPFKIGEPVKIKIEDGKLIIEASKRRK